MSQQSENSQISILFNKHNDTMMILKTDDEAFDETDSKVKDELLRQLANCRTAFLKNILEIS